MLLTNSEVSEMVLETEDGQVGWRAAAAAYRSTS